MDFCHQVWSSKDFKPVRTLAGHESKITSLDVVAGEFSLNRGFLELLSFGFVTQFHIIELT